MGNTYQLPVTFHKGTKNSVYFLICSLRLIERRWSINEKYGIHDGWIV